MNKMVGQSSGDPAMLMVAIRNSLWRKGRPPPPKSGYIYLLTCWLRPPDRTAEDLKTALVGSFCPRRGVKWWWPASCSRTPAYGPYRPRHGQVHIAQGMVRSFFSLPLPNYDFNPLPNLTFQRLLDIRVDEKGLPSQPLSACMWVLSRMRPLEW